MATKIAKTTYFAGPLDELAVKDIYKEKSSAVVNSFQDSLADALKLADKIPGLGLGDIAGKLNGLIGNLPNGALGSLSGLKGLGGITGNLASVNSAISGISRQLGGAGSISAISSAINSAFASMGGISSLVNQVNQTVSTVGGLQNSILGGLGRSLGVNLSQVRSLLNLVENNALTRLVTRDNPFRGIAHNSGYTSLESIARDLSRGSSDMLSNVRDLPSGGSRYDRSSHGVRQPYTTPVGRTIDSSKPAEINDTIAQIGERVQRLPNNSARTAEPIARMITTLTDSPYTANINNRGAQAAAIAAVVNEANKLNMPQAYQHVAQHVKDRQVLYYATKPIVEAAAERKDLKAIEAISNTSMAGEIKNIAPGIVQELAGNISSPDNLAEQEYTRYYQGIKETFDSIDPKWTKYKRKGSSDCINAAQVGDNYFFCDLIRAQMNELMSPDSYKSNLQRSYSSTMGFDTDTGRDIDKLINDNSSTINSAVDPNTATAGDAYGVLSNVISIKDDTGKETKRYDFSDEAFMLLAPLFKEDTVDYCLKRDFPYWYIAYPDKPIEETTTYN